MTLHTIPPDADIDIEGTLLRFGGNENLMMRFFKKFLSDPTFSELALSMETNDYSIMELHSHTLKGLAANLGLNKIRFASDVFLQAVRSKNYDQLPSLYEDLKAAYETTAEVISQLD